MKIMNPFNLNNSPIDGSNLIEASAGTGKTYTIASLFIRFILEKKISHDKILVVTFTDAATKELKERIRARIKELYKAMTNEKSDDRFISDIANNFKDKQSVETINDILKAFDQVQIHTIHGFCRKMLIENAFESHTLFDTEIVKDQDGLLRQITDDFYRKNFHKTSPLYAGYAYQSKINPDSLNRFLLTVVGKQNINIIPDFNEVNFSKIETKYLEIYRKVQEIWFSDQKQIGVILLESKSLNRNKYQVKTISKLLAEMDSFLNYGEKNTNLFPGFEKFGNEYMENSVKKNMDQPEHIFFDVCQEFFSINKKLIRLYDQHIINIKRSLVLEGLSQLKIVKQKKNVLGFDDLLSDMHKALYAEHGNQFIDNIRKKFNVALIDEFQDTDPVQFEIFNKIFPEKSDLFLIGDPKQAIYSFRGADIYSYKKASEKTLNKYTLSNNYRSDNGLVKAVNTIFKHNKNPFFFDWIGFSESIPADSSEISNPPFNIWYLESENYAGKNRVISRSIADRIITENIAREIIDILEDNSNGFQQRDIAILVRKNNEAEFVKNILAGYGLKSVIYSNASVFDSMESVELSRILKAISNPDNKSFIKAALATEAMGYSLADITSIVEDELMFEQILADFRYYWKIWRKSGFIKMIREFISKEKIISKVVKLKDGERKATNILHLTEVLHKYDSMGKGPEFLLKWFDEMKNPLSIRDDEGHVRLESDENLIKIVTIHKSKGMEYSVVFAPFLFNESKVNNPASHIFFYDKIDEKLSLDIGSENKELNLNIAIKESLAENLRILYVALTRAKNRCYMAYGKIGKYFSSAPSYLFHGSGDDNFTERVKKLSDNEMITEIKALCAKSEGTINFSILKEHGHHRERSFKTTDFDSIMKPFNSSIDDSFKVSSFSALTSMSKSYKNTDYSFLYEDEVKTQGVMNIFSFPKGAVPGLFMHEIFEDINYAESSDLEITEIVKEKLLKYDFEEEWAETIIDMVNKVLYTNLDEDTELSLSKIDTKNRINELEFYFPVSSITSKGINQILSDEGLNFSKLKGYMKGYIDLIIHHEGKYYILDWKSNYLGDSLFDYNYENLKEAIEENYYHLQYYIYTVALHKYLKIRVEDYDFETNFGGVFYIFLRGVDSESNTGIYSDRPSLELIEKFEFLFDRGEN